MCPFLLTVYQTFIGAMNERIKRQLAISNPFVFKHISSLKVQSYLCSVHPIDRRRAIV